MAPHQKEREAGKLLIEATDEIERLQRICELIGSIYFYGNFRAETENERELEALLRELGYFFENEEQLIARLHSNRH